MKPPLHTPLRRTIGRTAVAAAAVVLVGVAVAYFVTDRMMDQLSAATERFVEEQRVADQIGQAVVRQLVAASAGASRGDPGARRAFNEAGERVYRLIQDYLFRTLSPSERLQLETIKRAHQRLEVAAVRAADMEDRGDVASADGARTRMFAHASALLSEVEAFMRMREEGLQRLRAEQARLVRTLFLLIGLGALALLGGALLAGRFLHRRVSLPLARLLDATSRIGGGDLEARIEASHDDEIGAVAASFNRMAENLSEAHRRLEARNAELGGALEKIRSTQEELVQAEKMSALGRMTAGLAHELNNPLASLLSHAELLAAEIEDGTAPGADELREHFVEPLVQEGRRARGLVQNLLGFSRKSEGTLGPVPLRASLDVVVGLRRHAFEQAGLELELHEVPDVHVRAERQRLQDAFVNVLNNSLDAMTECGVTGGRLRVQGSVEAGRARLFFDDDGPGFAEPDRVFEPFYTTKPVGQGTGLGLALVHRFLAECGGSVAAAAAPGGGARTVVELPLCEIPSVHAPAATTDGDGGNGSPRVRGSPRVLVVEDEPHLRRVQERLLRRLGVDPVLAASAAEARAVIEGEEIAFVISDVRMPNGSGIELYQWIREHHPRLAMRLLFVTGDLYGAETRELAAARPDLFIEKPFEMEEYLARVSASLRQTPVA